MNSRTNTKEESHAKNIALAMLQQEPNLKSVTVKGIKITVVDGSLKTDWQVEEMRQHELSVETSRQQEIEDRANSLLGRHSEEIVDAMQIDDVWLKKKEDGLEIFDPWND
jgi:hypothetical protein